MATLHVLFTVTPYQLSVVTVILDYILFLIYFKKRREPVKPARIVIIWLEARAAL